MTTIAEAAPTRSSGAVLAGDDERPLSLGLLAVAGILWLGVAALVLAWPVMVLPSWAAWYYGWGMYWAWAFASLYVILLSLTVLARFRQGRWQSVRVIEAVGAR